MDELEQEKLKSYVSVLRINILLLSLFLFLLNVGFGVSVLSIGLLPLAVVVASLTYEFPKDFLEDKKFLWRLEALFLSTMYVFFFEIFSILTGDYVFVKSVFGTLVSLAMHLSCLLIMHYWWVLRYG